MPARLLARTVHNALVAHLPNIDEFLLPSVRDGVDIGASFHLLRVLQEDDQPESFGRNNLSEQQTWYTSTTT